MHFIIVKMHFENYCMNKRKEHRFFGSFVIIHSIYLQKCHEDKQLEQKVGLFSRAHYMAYSEIICRRIDHICCRVLVHIFSLRGGQEGGFLRRPPNKGWPGGQCGGLLVKIKASCVCCTENWDMNKKEVESMITLGKKLLLHNSTRIYNNIGKAVEKPVHFRRHIRQFSWRSCVYNTVKISDDLEIFCRFLGSLLCLFCLDF